MVPPANRRPGYSRRAQYGNFLGYLIAFIGLAQQNTLIGQAHQGVALGVVSFNLPQGGLHDLAA